MKLLQWKKKRFNFIGEIEEYEYINETSQILKEVLSLNDENSIVLNLIKILWISILLVFYSYIIFKLNKFINNSFKKYFPKFYIKKIIKKIIANRFESIKQKNEFLEKKIKINLKDKIKF